MQPVRAPVAQIVSDPPPEPRSDIIGILCCVMWSLCASYLGMTMLAAIAGYGLAVLPHLVGPVAICYAIDRAVHATTSRRA